MKVRKFKYSELEFLKKKFLKRVSETFTCRHVVLHRIFKLRTLLASHVLNNGFCLGIVTMIRLEGVQGTETHNRAIHGVIMMWGC